MQQFCYTPTPPPLTHPHLRKTLQEGAAMPEEVLDFV